MWCGKRCAVAFFCILATACVNANLETGSGLSEPAWFSETACSPDGRAPGETTGGSVRAFQSEPGKEKTNPNCDILPAGGALNGDRYRILVTTDLPADTDDIQSLIHLLLVSDLFDIEGLVTAPPTFRRTREFMREQCGSGQKTACIHNVLDQYELDYPNLSSWSKNYPHPDSLRELVKAGNETPWEESGSEESEGSRWIVERALDESDDRPLYILGWGAITNTATALLHHPEIADRIRIVMTGWSNVNKDQQAYEYIRDHYPDVFFVEAEGAMFGVRYPEKAAGYDNYTLCDVIEHKGAMGRYWCESRREYVDQDFVTVYYLLAGNPENPAGAHWGGRYENVGGNRWRDIRESRWQMTLPETGDTPGVRTSSRWRKPRMDHLMALFERTVQTGEGQHRGLFEMTFTGDPASYLEDDFYLNVVWTLPDGSQRTSDGFYDGGNYYKARAYAEQIGEWRWWAESSDSKINNASGSFYVGESDLPGKLKKHDQDPFQFQYDNGDWFLHLGDTAYRFVNSSETNWKRYLKQADKAGFTKIRTWFNGGRYDVQDLFDESRSRLNTPYWQEIDKRLRYAQAYYPHIQFQLIPYGEDTEEIRRYLDDPLTQKVARTAQARFSALPNVQWCIVNDREIIETGTPENERQVLAESIRQIGRDMAGREPWGSLLTSHQARLEGYSFVHADWSDIITLEDLDQVGGALVRDYRASSPNDPVVLEEDRYELFRGPDNPGYFFRRLFWSTLLAGGHATYGGLASYELADSQDDTKGIIGYYDSQKTTFPLTGADQFRFIHKFYRNTGLTMAGFSPASGLSGANDQEFAAASDGVSTILYLANPESDEPETAAPSSKPYRFRLRWPRDAGSASLSWFNPRNGQWETRADIVKPGLNWLATPKGGDWVGLVQ